LLECLNRHADEPVDRILRLMLGKKAIDQFDHVTRANGAIVIFEQLHRRIEKICRLNAHQIAVLFLEEHDAGMGQRLQRRAEAIFHTPGPVGNASNLAVFPAEKSNDAVSFANRISFKNDRVALLYRHGSVIIACRFRERRANVALPTVEVVGLGLNAMDTICLVERFPVPGTKTSIREVRSEPGGQVATALTTCARFGLTTRYIGSVGDDDLGRAQLRSLRTDGLGTEFVRVVKGVTTQFAVILLEEGVGERTIVWHHDSKLNYPAELLNREVITSARVLHLDGCDTEAALQAATWARQAGIPVVADIDELYDSSTEELLRNVDYLIAAEEFAKQTVPDTSPEDAIRELAARYGNLVVGITLGDRGAIFWKGGRLLQSPALKVRVADTTGAGDVFHGAFIFGLLQSWPLEQIARFANAAAGLKCAKFGARGGIPSLDEVLHQISNRW